MLPNEFKEILNRLILTYGEKFYPDVRCEIIWESVKEMPKDWFSRFVDRWIGSNLKPLLVDEIRNATSFEKEKKLFDTSDSKKPINCKECRDSGFVYKDLAVDKEFNPIKSRSPKPDERAYSFSYRCNCVTGQLQNRNIATWH